MGLGLYASVVEFRLWRTVDPMLLASGSDMLGYGS